MCMCMISFNSVASRAEATRGADTEAVLTSRHLAPRKAASERRVLCKRARRAATGRGGAPVCGEPRGATRAPPYRAGPDAVRFVMQTL